MEKEYASNGTVSSVFEASGVGGGSVTRATNVRSKLPEKRIAVKKENVEITDVWSTDFKDIVTTAKPQTKMGVDESDTEVMNSLQTSVLLIAVLTVCFLTFVAVIAICGCIIRNYCKKNRREATMAAHGATMVSKFTSMTGLNLPSKYDAARVEANNHENSADAAQDTFDVKVCSELNCKVPVLVTRSGSLPTTRKRNSAELSDSQNSNIGSQTNGEADSPLTSTPTVSKPHCDNDGDTQDSGGVLRPIPSNLQSAAVEKMISPVCHIAFNSAIRDQMNSNDEIPSLVKEQNSGSHLAAEQVTMPAPLTQSVSWFVSLNGDRTGSIRHSITDKTYQELNMKNYENCPPDQRNSQCPNKVTGKVNSERLLLYKLDERETNISYPMSVTSSLSNNDSICDAAEEAPLIKATRNPTASVQSSVPHKRSKLSTSQSDTRETCDTMVFGTRSQSLSDDTNIWKQREERPVVFLGAGVK